MSEHIYKGASDSKQHIGRDSLNPNGTIEPFFSFNEMLLFFYHNTYHQKAVKLKAKLLSLIEETTLSNHLPSGEFPRTFMQGFATDLEIYGNAFMEKAGNGQNFNLYQILGFQARLNKEKKIFQLTEHGQSIELEGYHLKYYSPSGKYYGEPDYLTTLEQILTTKRADKYNANFFKNGAKPGYGIVFENSSPSKDQQTAFKNFFGENYKGHENAHKSIALWTGKSSEGSPPAKIRLENLSGIDDMSFEKLKKVNRDEIIAAHGVPPRLVGVMAAGQLGGGTELIDQLHAFNQTEILPKKELIEEFFGNIGIKHKIKELDVTNFKDDNALVTGLVSSNIITPEEAKELLGLKQK